LEKKRRGGERREERGERREERGERREPVRFRDWAEAGASITHDL